VDWSDRRPSFWSERAWGRLEILGLDGFMEPSHLVMVAAGARALRGIVPKAVEQGLGPMVAGVGGLAERWVGSMMVSERGCRTGVLPAPSAGADGVQAACRGSVRCVSMSLVRASLVVKREIDGSAPQQELGFPEGSSRDV
jgi:predicted dinucleotide-utilizing enzyme